MCVCVCVCQRSHGWTVRGQDSLRTQNLNFYRARILTRIRRGRARQRSGVFITSHVPGRNTVMRIQDKISTIYFCSDREICRTCRTCPADFCWCPAESSDLAGHFVQQSSIHIKCPTRKTRMNNDICPSSTGKNVWQRLEMSGRALMTCRTFCRARPK